MLIITLEELENKTQAIRDKEKVFFLISLHEQYNSKFGGKSLKLHLSTYTLAVSIFLWLVRCFPSTNWKKNQCELFQHYFPNQKKKKIAPCCL